MKLGEAIALALVLAIASSIMVSCVIAEQDCTKRGGFYAKGIYGYECMQVKPK